MDPDDTFNQTSRGISLNLQTILQNVTSIQRLVNQLGTSQDSQHVRDELQLLHQGTNHMVREANDSLMALSSLPSTASVSENKQRRLQRERFASQFAEVLKQFQAIQKVSAEKEKDSVVRVRASFSASHESDDEVEKQMHALLEQKQIKVLREREEAVKQIESDIRDVNKIFIDLATLVQDQGSAVDTIEANVGVALNQVEQGGGDIQQAVVYQQKARSKMICLIAILIIVLFAVALAIYLAFK